MLVPWVHIHTQNLPMKGSISKLLTRHSRSTASIFDFSLHPRALNITQKLTGTPFIKTLTSRFLQPEISFDINVGKLSQGIRRGVEFRIKAYHQSMLLLDQLKTNSSVDEDLIQRFDTLYQDLRKSTKILQYSLPDPMYFITLTRWGLKVGNGLLTEQEIRDHLINELEFLVLGIEREIKQLAS